MDESNQARVEEVSIVDLLVVLLRHRKMIVALTSGVVLAAALLLYVGPMLGLEEPPSYSIESISAPVVPIPNAVQGWLEINPSGDVSAYINSVADQIGLYREVHAASARELSDDQVYAIFKNSVLVKQLSTDYNRVTRRITIGYKTTEPELGRKYLTQLWSRAEDVVVRLGREQLAAANAKVELALSILDSEGSSKDVMVRRSEILLAQAALAELAAMPDFPFSGGAQIFSAEEAKKEDRAERLALAVIAAALGSVLLAFLLDAIQRLRADPAAMGRLKEALR